MVFSYLLAYSGCDPDFAISLGVDLSFYVVFKFKDEVNGFLDLASYLGDALGKGSYDKEFWN